MAKLETEHERTTDSIYRVSAAMLAVMQRDIAREPDGRINVRLGMACLAGALARWLAVGTPKSKSVEATIDWAQGQLRELMVVMLNAERERLADEATEHAKGAN